MEDAIYGGRIDNAFDLRVLRSYLRYVRTYTHTNVCHVFISDASRNSLNSKIFQFNPLITLLPSYTVYVSSVFFNEDLVSDRGAGCEVLLGTSLRMPKIPDYESCRRIIDKVVKVVCLLCSVV